VLGRPISQATEFACPPTLLGRDHRLSELVVQSKTGADGSFKIENIPQGSPREINSSSISRGGYNFVAQKQGFGWKYIYNLGIK